MADKYQYKEFCQILRGGVPKVYTRKIPLIPSDLCILDSSTMQQSEKLKHSHFVRSLHTRFSYWILIPSDLCIPDGSPASEEGQQEDPQRNWVITSYLILASSQVFFFISFNILQSTVGNNTKHFCQEHSSCAISAPLVFSLH